MVCPITPTPTPPFPHDHNPNPLKRRIDIDGVGRPYFDQLVWAGLAIMPGLHATAISAGRLPEGLAVGVQPLGPMFEYRTPAAAGRSARAERPMSSCRIPTMSPGRGRSTTAACYSAAAPFVAERTKAPGGCGQKYEELTRYSYSRRYRSALLTCGLMRLRSVALTWKSP